MFPEHFIGVKHDWKGLATAAFLKTEGPTRSGIASEILEAEDASKGLFEGKAHMSYEPWSKLLAKG